MLVISGEDQKHLAEVTTLLYSVIGKSPSAMQKLVQSRILVGTEEPERELMPDGT